MRYGTILSFLMHLAILLLILYGLPDLFTQQEVIEPVAVQLATVADLTAQPQPKQQAQTPPTPVMKPAPTPPAPQAPSPPPAPVPPQPAEQTPPPPVPQQEAPQPPQPTVAEPPQPIIIPDKTQPPPPQQPPQQQAQIEQAPVPKLRPKTPPDQTKPKVQPATQTADFNSLLKNLTQSQPQSQTADITDQPPQPTPDQSAPIGQQLSSSDLDAVRSQIAGCWFLDPGKKGADSMVIDIHVDLGPDGTVLGNPQILDTMRAATDPMFQAAAEAARRALLKCSPLRLPPDKYDTWKSTIFRFNPGGMLG